LENFIGADQVVKVTGWWLWWLMAINPFGNNQLGIRHRTLENRFLKGKVNWGIQG